MRGRLNLFQVAMLRWRALHPYNAVHVVRVERPLALPRLAQAIDRVREAWGLTALALDAERGRYEWTGVPARTEVAVVAPGADPERAIDTEIARQLNAAFPAAGLVDPFRFFVVDRGDAFDLGLSYDHFVAAGDSIVALLKAIVDRYGAAGPESMLATAGEAVGAENEATMRGHGPSSPAPLRPTTARAAPARGPAPPRDHAPDLYPPTYGRLLLRQLRPMLAGLRRVPAIVARFRSAYRPRYPHGEGKDNAFVHLRIAPAGLAALQRRARAWGVTLNDLVLALVLQALSPLTEARRAEPRRHALAVAAIVNIRADCGPAAAGAFGQFLTSFLVAHPVPAGTSLEVLARAVRADTARIKREKLYLQTLLAMAASGLAWRLLSARRRAGFHAKAYPVWAGTSSLNVDALWTAAPGSAGGPAYVRAIPTGPLAPLVVAATTAKGELVLGLSYRPAAFTPGDVATITGSISQGIARLD